MSSNLPHGLVELNPGHWFLDHPPIDYDGDYFQKYVEMDKTPFADLLVKSRIDLVKRHTALVNGLPGKLVDIGIGGGRFCQDMGCYGFDVNPSAIAWLELRGKFLNPYKKAIPYVACWDSLEHIQRPEGLIFSALSHLFASVPIFKDVDDVINSKHFKPGEHLHYWTRQGLEDFMTRQKFKLVEWNNIETLLGRESVLSFAFERDPR